MLLILSLLLIAFGAIPPPKVCPKLIGTIHHEMNITEIDYYILITVAKGRLSYHLSVECFSQLSFDSEVYAKAAVYTLLNQMRVVKNIRHKDDRMKSLYE